METKILLNDSQMPKAWYNIIADMPNPPAPVLHPGTGKPVTPDDSNTPEFIPVVTNKPGPLPGGKHEFLSGADAILQLRYIEQALILGGTLNVVFRRGNVVATQFHPEKSSDAGLRILTNFLEVCR